MAEAAALPSATELAEMFLYEAETGSLCWRIKPAKCILIGDVVGHMTRRGYVQVQIAEQRYLAHRIVWKLLTGQEPLPEIDHINGNPADNRFENLRLATRVQNRANSPATKKHGLKGASFKVGKWEAGIKIGGKTIYLGRFKTEQEAHKVYCEAARKHFGEFARER